MKVLDPAVQAKLDSGFGQWVVTVKIETLYGEVLAFTDGDTRLTIDGVVYDPLNSFVQTQLTDNNSKVISDFVLDILINELIPFDNVMNEVYDGSKVTMAMYNPFDTTETLGILRVGFLGSITSEDQKVRWQTKSIKDMLNQDTSDILKRSCKHILGDAGCKFNLTPYTYEGTITNIISGGYEINIPTAPTSGDPTHFDFGLVIWKTGANVVNGIGVVRMIRTATYVAATRWNVYLSYPMFAQVQLGDVLDVIAGCDKSATTCASTKFLNFENFLGAPFVPKEGFFRSSGGIR